MAGERLILTGFMGMGKSTIGPKVAGMLGSEYYDTDDWMEKSGIDVPKLVKTDMTAFRALEASALAEILSQEPGVISTGGGIVSTEVGRKALLAANTPVVWLNAPFDVAVSRVSQGSGRERPLFSDVDKARELYQQRFQWYQETAQHTVDASQPIRLVVGEIVEIAQSHQTF